MQGGIWVSSGIWAWASERLFSVYYEALDLQLHSDQENMTFFVPSSDCKIFTR